jgi:Putative motility protein
MDATSPVSSTNALVNDVSASRRNSVGEAASTMVLKKALDQQATSTMQLLSSVPQASLATSGSLGTKVNTWA